MSTPQFSDPGCDGSACFHGVFHKTVHLWLRLPSDAFRGGLLKNRTNRIPCNKPGDRTTCMGNHRPVEESSKVLANCCELKGFTRCRMLTLCPGCA